MDEFVFGDLNQEFITKLTDSELCEWFEDRLDDHEYNPEDLTWKMCDTHEIEYGVLVDLSEMDSALLFEMAERFFKSARK